MRDLLKKILMICAVIGSFGTGTYFMASGVESNVRQSAKRVVDETLLVTPPPILTEPVEKTFGNKNR